MSNRLNYLSDSTVLSRPSFALSTDPRVDSDYVTFDNGQRINWKRGYTTDAMMTFDDNFAFTRDSTGAFLIGELERLDQTLHDPLLAVTWGRDIQLREDVTIADEVSSFTNSSFASAGGISPTGKHWASKDANAISGIALDIGKTTRPLFLWAMEIKYTLPELASAQKLGRPIDTQKYDGLKMAYQMDVDNMVYLGDTEMTQRGLFNSEVANGGLVANTNALQAGASSPTAQTTSLKWIDKTPDAILADVNLLLTNVWAASGWAIMPEELRVDPVSFGYLVSQKVSTAGNVSLIEFLRNNSLCNAANGRPLNIQPVKWLAAGQAATAARAVAYTNDRNRVRYPLVPLQRTPLEYRSMYQIITYYGRLGCVEFVYPETIGYLDGIG